MTTTQLYYWATTGPLHSYAAIYLAHYMTTTQLRRYIPGPLYDHYTATPLYYWATI